MNRIRNLLTLLLCFSLCIAGELISQSSVIVWSSFNMGYASSTSGNAIVQSVIGQSFVGATQSGETWVISGFLADAGTILGVEENTTLPDAYRLNQNYPNPFNPSTTIHFELPKESHVTLRVYNMLGQEVLTVLNNKFGAGRYDVKIDGANISSGLYFYRLVAADFVQTKKMMLVK